MIMFCGLPVIVAAPPTFEAVATASRYGTGSRRRRRARPRTSGVSTRHTVSFTRKADPTPAASVTTTSRASGRRTRAPTHAAARSKAPAIRRCAATIITPSSSASVFQSTARQASSSGNAPTATMSAAPSSAAPVRSMRRPGIRPTARMK